MSRLQVIVVGITIGLNALDGFDVLAISFASPGIAREWGIDPAALGFVLSMELVGMAIGSVLLGGVADKVGRRPTILLCLSIMAGGMLMATTAQGVIALSTWRVVTGLGIGGMLAAINAVAAEFSNARRRHLSVSLMSIGYPAGAVVGGVIAAELLEAYNWRAVFYFGAAVTSALIPVVYLVVPESVHWLARKQPANALDKINRGLARMKHGVVAALPVIPPDMLRRSASDIFAPGLLASTVIVTLAYFFHITTFYFILKWVPKIVVDMGFEASAGARVVVWANVGGFIGGAIFGLLTQRYRVKTLTIVLLVLSAVMVTLFGRTPADFQRLALICAIAGFCGNAGIVGLYAIIAQAFPTHARAFGTGFTIGVGRGGSALAPMVAGLLFAAGYSLPVVALTMGVGSLLAAGVLLLLRLDGDDPTPERADRRLGPSVMPAPSRAQ
jgi:benzoate transport